MLKENIKGNFGIEMNPLSVEVADSSGNLEKEGIPGKINKNVKIEEKLKN